MIDTMLDRFFLRLPPNNSNQKKKQMLVQIVVVVVQDIIHIWWNIPLTSFPPPGSLPSVWWWCI